MRILILGAGFGGLDLATRLSDEFGEEIDVILIDKSEGFVFGFSKLDVMFGKKTATDVLHPYGDIDKPGLRFVSGHHRLDRSTVQARRDRRRSIRGRHPRGRPGSRPSPVGDPRAHRGRSRVLHGAGAFALRDVLASFDGGHVIVGVTSLPFKCPPAPSETVLLLHDFLTERGIRDVSSISLVMPLGVPIPPSPAASEALLVAFAERGIDWHPGRMVTGLDPDRKVALLSDGSEMPYDLFLGVPVHKAPPVVEKSGLAVDGWIPVNPLTLETSYPDVYAVGDVTSVGTPKAGVFAEGQASVVAAQIGSRLRGGETNVTYDGQGICYLEFGRDQVARVRVTFLSGAAPVGDIEGPSRDIAADKDDFGATRVRRWFDRDWG